jgi:hypothetical protein
MVARAERRRPASVPSSELGGGRVRRDRLECDAPQPRRWSQEVPRGSCSRQLDQVERPGAQAPGRARARRPSHRARRPRRRDHRRGRARRTPQPRHATSTRRPGVRERDRELVLAGPAVTIAAAAESTSDTATGQGSPPRSGRYPPRRGRAPRRPGSQAPGRVRARRPSAHVDQVERPGARARARRPRHRARRPTVAVAAAAERVARPNSIRPPRPGRAPRRPRVHERDRALPGRAGQPTTVRSISTSTQSSA